MSFKIDVNNPDYQRGVRDFHEGKIKSESIKAKLYKAVVPTKQWNEHYSKINSYTFLNGDRENTDIGFWAVITPPNCLEITNQEELNKIKAHYGNQENG